MSERTGLKLVQESDAAYHSEGVSEMSTTLVRLAAAFENEELHSLLIEAWTKYSHNLHVRMEIEKIIIARYGDAWFTIVVLGLEHMAKLAKDVERAERLQKLHLLEQT